MYFIVCNQTFFSTIRDLLAFQCTTPIIYLDMHPYTDLYYILHLVLPCYFTIVIIIIIIVNKIIPIQSWRFIKAVKAYLTSNKNRTEIHKTVLLGRNLLLHLLERLLF
jgi:hypothetical protein